MTNYFEHGFDSYVCEGDSITCSVDGFEIRARLIRDNDSGAPWEREDGHGPVTDWERRSKGPGERVLCGDGRGRLGTDSARRFYDFQKAVKIARRDGWDSEPFGVGTRRERAARAVEADFKRLQRWCADDWFYVGVVLSIERAGVVLDSHAASLWGIESDSPDYLLEVANELAEEAIARGREVLETLKESQS